MEDILGVRLGEREMLGGFLGWYRAVVENKLADLTVDQATRVMTPSGLCPLGVVKHLGWVERAWFRETFGGEEIEMIAVGEDNSPEFRVEPDDTIESVVAFYREEAEHSRRLASEASSLDSLSAKPTPWREYVSLRWIIVHMLEETARHAGHLDLMREQIDGRTGDQPPHSRCCQVRGGDRSQRACEDRSGLIGSTIMWWSVGTVGLLPSSRSDLLVV